MDLTTSKWENATQSGFRAQRQAVVCPETDLVDQVRRDGATSCGYAHQVAVQPGAKPFGRRLARLDRDNPTVPVDEDRETEVEPLAVALPVSYAGTCSLIPVRRQDRLRRLGGQPEAS
jgi:hypothetical protein